MVGVRRDNRGNSMLDWDKRWEVWPLFSFDCKILVEEGVTSRSSGTSSADDSPFREFISRAGLTTEYSSVKRYTRDWPLRVAEVLWLPLLSVQIGGWVTGTIIKSFNCRRLMH